MMTQSTNDAFITGVIVCSFKYRFTFTPILDFEATPTQTFVGCVLSRQMLRHETHVLAIIANVDIERQVRL